MMTMIEMGDAVVLIAEAIVVRHVAMCAEVLLRDQVHAGQIVQVCAFLLAKENVMDQQKTTVK